MLNEEFDAALVAHIKWLVIFKNHLSGVERDRLDPDAVRDDTACHFGKWLHANKETPLFSAQFGHIEPIHGAFHCAAAEVATAINIERLAMLHAASLTSAVREINPDMRVAFVVPPGGMGADVREILAPLVVPRYKFGVFDTLEDARGWV